MLFFLDVVAYFTLFLNRWFFRSFRLLCIVVCCFGLCSIVVVCVKLVWICFRSSMEFSTSLLFQIVSRCFRFCCFFLLVGKVVLLGCMLLVAVKLFQDRMVLF